MPNQNDLAGEKSDNLIKKMNSSMESTVFKQFRWRKSGDAVVNYGGDCRSLGQKSVLPN
jgi:hypothetical protein